MPLGVALSELRYELRAEIYSSLLPAHGISAVDMQNVILERTQRELWNLYAWPHLDYKIDFDLAANTQYVTFDPTMPFENVVALWRNYEPDNQQPWIQLRYGFDDSINELLTSYPPTRWRNVVTVDATSGLTNFAGQAQIWPIPSQLSHMRWHGQAPLNPLKVDTDQCMIEFDRDRAHRRGRAARGAKERSGDAQGAEGASLYSPPARALRREQARHLGDGSGAHGAAYQLQRRDALPRLHSGAVSFARLSDPRLQERA